MKVSDKVLHRLKNECEFVQKADRKVCKICGAEKNEPLKLNVFHQGETVSADTINYNFDILAQVTQEHSKAIRSIENILDNRLKLMERTMREARKNVGKK